MGKREPLALRNNSRNPEVIDPELLEAEAKEARARKYGGGKLRPALMGAPWYTGMVLVGYAW